MTENDSAKETLLRLPSVPASIYSEIDLNRLTVYSIFRLKQLDVPCTIENIAVANYKMFPRRFAMVGFPEYPDISRVNRALLQLRPKYRNWATGNTRLGWALTASGVAEAQAIANQITARRDSDKGEKMDALEAEPAGVMGRTIHAEGVLKRIHESTLFAKWKDDWREVSALEVFDVLDAYTHTPTSVLRSKTRELRRVAHDQGAKDIVQFLDAVIERFPTLFNK
jgi:hypothetical protein